MVLLQLFVFKIKGHSVFYDIYFVTGSADIESKADNQIADSRLFKNKMEGKIVNS